MPNIHISYTVLTLHKYSADINSLGLRPSVSHLLGPYMEIYAHF
jgi:hypothetical protein